MKTIKRTGVICLAALLTAALVLPVQGASSRIDGYAARSLEELYALGQDGDPSDIELAAGDEIRIPLTADMFSWSDGRMPGNMEAVSVRQLNSGRVKVRAQRIRGSVTLDYLQFDTDVFPGQPFLKPNSTVRTGRTAHISVILSREFAGIEDMPFEYVIYLTVDGERHEELEITLTGTLRVDVQQVGAGDDYVDLSDGEVIEAESFVRGIAMDLGNGLRVQANLFEGQRYRGICKIVDHRGDSRGEPDAEQDEAPELYPEIAMVYRLSAENLRERAAAVQVRIDVPEDSAVYHVYGEDMQYLGTTADELAYSELYILCTGTMSQVELAEYENYEEPPAQEVEPVYLDNLFASRTPPGAQDR